MGALDFKYLYRHGSLMLKTITRCSMEFIYMRFRSAFAFKLKKNFFINRCIS